MKTLTTIIALCLTSFLFAQEKGVTVTVVFDNLVNDQGTVSASLFDEATFMRAAPLVGAKGKPENKTLTLELENVTPGEYGIITLHDFNENGRMDFESNGMPSEPYGISGDVVPMGPPTFADAKFTVGTEDLTIHIKM